MCSPDSREEARRVEVVCDEVPITVDFSEPPSFLGHEERPAYHMCMERMVWKVSITLMKVNRFVPAQKPVRYSDVHDDCYLYHDM